MEAPQKKQIMVWDLPTRIFHWLLVILLIGAVISAKTGFVEQHAIIGILLAALLFFRIIWGFVGSETARFRYFIKGPQAISAYIKDKSNYNPLSHNPLGALMVVVMLLLLILQVILGLFSNDDVLFEAPLASMIASDLSDKITVWHHRVSNLLFALIVIHILAVFVHRRDRLTHAMITGYKYLQYVPAKLPLFVSFSRAISVLIAAILLAVFLLNL